MIRSNETKKVMNIKRMRRRYLILAVIMACVVLVLDNEETPVQADNQPMPQESAEQQFLDSDEQEPIKGYPTRKRRIGGPTDVEWDLDNSFPKRGSVLELILRCQETHD